MKELLIVGASVRAAVQSAVRSGWKVVAADVFGDCDLRAVADYVPVACYPRDLASIRRRFAHLPVMYTGALENHPRLLESMQSHGPLLGNTAAAVRQLRDAQWLARAFCKHNIPFPQTTTDLPVGEASRWLRKPVRSAGGARIARCDVSDALVAEQDFYFQQFVPGQAVSASFVAADGKVVLLGATTMLVGCPWLGAENFVYAGSVLRPLCTEERNQWLHIGTSLVREFPLKGLFGVDAILGEAGLVPLEVNPRYTASMEVLERSQGISMVQVHHDAVTAGCLPAPPEETGVLLSAKAILYARNEVRAAATWPRVTSSVVVADRPESGARIQPGRPILSLLVTAPRLTELVPLLQQQAEMIYGQRMPVARTYSGSGPISP